MPEKLDTNKVNNLDKSKLVKLAQPLNKLSICEIL